MNDWAVEETTRGFFWRADGQADEACPGTLTLTSDGGATLELFGWEREAGPAAQRPPALIPDQSPPLSVSPALHHRVLRAVLELFGWAREAGPTAQRPPALVPDQSHPLFPTLTSHRRILGAVEGLGCVTLDRCVATGAGRSGELYLSRASYKVESVIRGLHYKLDEKMSLCRMGFYATGLEQMLHGLGDQETTLDDGCVLRFAPDSDFVTVHAEIQPRTATSLLHLSRHALAVRDFLTLARMRESAIYGMWATEENAPSDHAVVKIRAPLPWNRPGVERDFISPDMMLFAADDVKANLADVVGRWMSLYADYTAAVDRYFTNQYVTHAPIHIKLSTLFEAIDAWFRIDREVPDEKWTRPFGEALDDLISEYTRDLEISFSMLNDKKRIGKMRNEIIHPGRKTPLWDGDDQERVATERQLTLLMQICMLRKIGFSSEAVKGIVSKRAVKQLLHTKFIEFV